MYSRITVPDILSHTLLELFDHIDYLNSSIAVLSYTIVSIFIANHFSIQIKPLK